MTNTHEQRVSRPWEPQACCRTSALKRMVSCVPRSPRNRRSTSTMQRAGNCLHYHTSTSERITNGKDVTRFLPSLPAKINDKRVVRQVLIHQRHSIQGHLSTFHSPVCERSSPDVCLRESIQLIGAHHQRSTTLSLRSRVLMA